MRLPVLTKKLLPVSRIANVQFLETSSCLWNFQICLEMIHVQLYSSDTAVQLYMQERIFKLQPPVIR